MRFDNGVFELAAGRSGQLPAGDLPEIVFSGKSNVGKSSLINKLLNRKNLARVSATPGKTATINFYRLDQARLVDLPGYGYAKVSLAEKKRWAELVEGYFQQERNLALVVQLVDMRHPPTKDDLHMIEFLCDGGFPFLVALTKSDKLNQTERRQRLAALEEAFSDYEGLRLIPFCQVDAALAAREGEGDLSLAYWQRVHRDFFEKELAPYGERFDEGMELIFEEFELVYER